MTWLFYGLLIGLLAGWVIEWVIDVWYWRGSNKQLRQQLMAAHADNQQLQAHLGALQQRVTQLAPFENDAQTLEARLQHLEATNQRLQTEHRNATSTLAQDNQSLQSRLREVETANEHLKQQLTTKTDSLAAVENEAQSMQSRLRSIEAEKTTLLTQVQEHITTITTLESELKINQTNMLDAQAERQRLLAQLNKLRTVQIEANECQTRLRAAHNRITELEHKLNALPDTQDKDGQA